MLKDKIQEEGLDCCIDEVGEMMQNLVRTLQIFERMQISKKGFTNSQCYTLLNIYKSGPLAMKNLSEKMNLDNSTMTRVVNNLVRDDLIKREPSAEDRRVVNVRLTEKGEAEAEELSKEVIEYYRKIIEEIPEGKVIEIVESMDILSKAFSRIKPNCC